jgi:isocitrate lyase
MASAIEARLNLESGVTDFYNLVPSAPEGRFEGIERSYSPEDVMRLRGSIRIRHTLAEMGANRLWKLIHEEDFVNALGALSGNQAMQMVRAGLKAIYLSGWQVAADANTASAMYPDQSLYPANAAPELCRRINRTLQRADQIETWRVMGSRSKPGSRRSSPTPRPVSAARSMRSRS